MANVTFLYIGTGSGLIVAARPGTSDEWRITRQTLVGQQVTALAAGAAMPVRLLAAAFGAGLFHSPDSGRTWLLTLPEPPAALLADPTDPDRLYVATTPPAESDSSNLQPTRLLTSADGGQSWTALAPLPAADGRVLSMAYTAGNDEHEARLWLGLATGGVLYSTAGGSWQGLLLGLDARPAVRALAAAGPSPYDLYAATPTGVCRLETGVRTGDGSWKGTDLVWRTVGPDTPRNIRQLLALGRPSGNGRRPALLALTDDGMLWRADLAEGTWQNLSAALAPAASAEPPYLTALAPHPDYADRAYAAGRTGQVYETRDRGSTWQDTGLDAGGEVLCLTAASIK